MALLDPAALAEPISDSAPCGPDLDLEGDLEFMNFLARAEGLLPATFFTRDDQGRLGTFDRSTIAFDKEAQTIAAFLARTRDLRLLTLQAKLSILNRDLASFATALSAISRLAAERWADVHPQGDGGDYTLRQATLQTLDDTPTVILPLQHAPLVPSRRFGAIQYRHILVRKGDANAREGEEIPDEATIASAFRDVEFEVLLGIRDQVRSLQTALAEIQSTWIQNAGYDQAVTFPKLGPLVEKILETLEAAVERRDPGAATSPAQPGAADPGATGASANATAQPAASLAAIRSAPEASAALASAASYFAKSEPSSLALLLVRQAQQLVGRSFQEVIQTLVPNHAEQASVRIGIDVLFEIPVDRLAGVAADATDEIELPDTTSIGTADSVVDPEQAEHSPVEEPASNPTSLPNGNGIASRSPSRILTRLEAIALLEQVSVFYRLNEPASPIPLLVDRACTVAQKDFVSLLRDVLPGLTISSD